MDLSTEQVEDVLVVELPFEELDASNAGDFKLDVAPVLDRALKIVFDLSRVRFVDSSGLGAFLSSLRRVNERGGELKLCGLAKQVRAVFELVRLHRVFDILPSRAAAVAAFARAAPHAAPAAR